jgi:uncharacterized protein YciI
MPYLIDASDGPDVARLRPALREAHLAHINDHLPLILAAGAKLSEDGTPIGSAYLLDVEDRRAAEQFIQADPYVVGQVFGSVTITRWRKGFFDHARVVPAPPASASEPAEELR